MTLPRPLKIVVLGGCAAGYLSFALMSIWPSVLDVTHVPLYVGFVGAWCTFLVVGYLVFRFVLAGLRRSNRW